MQLTLSEHGMFDEKVLKILNQNKVVTILDFLQEDVEKLATITKLTVPQVLDFRSYFFKTYSAPVVNGRKLLLNNTSPKWLSTGIDRLDKLLNGGIPVGYITEIYGLAGSGKTQMCLQLALNIVRTSDNSVLYIDTKGDFTAIKIQMFLQRYGYTHKDMALLMLRIKIVHVWSMDDLIKLLLQLGKKMIAIHNLGLILIDSLPCLMFQYLGDDSKTSLPILNIFANHCKFLSKELNIGIVCVNIQTRWVDQDMQGFEDDNECSVSKERHYRCLGRYWQHIPALVLLLENKQESEKALNINISLIKSIFSKSGVSCSVGLNNLVAV